MATVVAFDKALHEGLASADHCGQGQTRHGQGHLKTSSSVDR